MADNMSSQRRAIIDDIIQERAVQDEKWGGLEHDRQHTIAEWKNIIMEHAHKASLAAYNGNTYRVRKRLIEVAAIAVAAIEALEHMNELKDEITED